VNIYFSEKKSRLIRIRPWRPSRTNCGMRTKASEPLR